MEQRVIKFKVWDSELKIWITNLGMKKNNVLCDGNEKRFHVCEFAGVYDKHGNEVYEKFLCLLFTDTPTEIIFKDGAFGYMSSDGYFVSFAQNRWFEFINSKSDSIEIIGNIYENPELINN